MTHVVYRLYDTVDTLLYVGSTANLERRLSEHRNRQRWGDSIARWTVDGPHEIGQARWLESEAIHRERPIFNRRRPTNVEVPEEVMREAVAGLRLPSPISP